MDVGSLTSAFTGASGSSESGGLGKMDFLKLLTTQLTHQDPLNPMQDTQFVAQLAQFSGLEQMMQTNERLEALAMAQSSMTSASAVGFLGKTVEAVSNQVELADGVPSWAGVRLDGDAASLKVEIRTATGEVVQVLELGAHNAGDVELGWDGLGLDGKPVADGLYYLSLEAEDTTGEPVGCQPLIKGEVSAVTFENGYAELLLGERRLGLADVIGMR